MKILVTGKGGRAGSWQMRAEQLGIAIGARVKAFSASSDFEQADVVIVVKRTPAEMIGQLARSGKPWIFDAVDCYPQPTCSAWSRSESIAWARSHIQLLEPHAVIWPTARMREDCNLDIPGVVIPHHHRPNIERNPIREKVSVVGYEGREAYLGQWKGILEHECKRRGWAFVVNPEHLAAVDIAVAFRNGQWNGYAQRHWKSAVKLANAHGSGTPFIAQMESGYLENSSGAEYWAENAHELTVSFDWLESQSAREQVSDRFIQAAYPLEKAAKTLKEFIRGL